MNSLKPIVFSFALVFAWERSVCPAKMRFHDLTPHAPALIASGLDVVAISRRLGHASAVVTLSVHAHLFTRSDEGVAAAIETTMTTGAEQ